MAIQTPTENWFKFPNHIADNLASYTTFEITILVLILRRTVGMLGLTKIPDQRFSQSFLVKNTGISDSQVYRAKKSLLAKGAIKEDGTAGDGSKLYSVVWDIPADTPLCPPEVAPSFSETNPPPPGRATDKDISLKTVETKTLDARASSAAPEKPSKKKKEPKFQRKDRPDIPFQEIALHFKNKHQEFRKTNAFYLPYKEDPKLVELWDILGTKEKVYEAIEAFIGYIKSGNSKESYIRNAPIMPSQILGVLNFTLPYWPSQSLCPKLEIKSYENKGIHIGKMPEGW